MFCFYLWQDKIVIISPKTENNKYFILIVFLLQAFFISQVSLKEKHRSYLKKKPKNPELSEAETPTQAESEKRLALNHPGPCGSNLSRSLPEEVWNLSALMTCL